MGKGRSEIIISLAMIIVMAVLVGLNVFLVEKTDAEARKITEALTGIEYMKTKIKEAETELLKQRMEKESIEILEFDEKYRELNEEYIKKAGELSGKINSKFINIEEIKELTVKRIALSREFKEELDRFYIPKPLKDFYEFKMELLDSDVETMNLVLSYYDSGAYSTYDDAGLKEAYGRCYSLFLKAEKEMEKVYEEYGLGHLLE